MRAIKLSLPCWFGKELSVQSGCKLFHIMTLLPIHTSVAGVNNTNTKVLHVTYLNILPMHVVQIWSSFFLETAFNCQPLGYPNIYTNL